MPRACPFHLKSPPVQVDPENQLPLMHFNDAPKLELKVFTWEEVRRHNKENDVWVVFNGEVYDVSSFATNHPGGMKVLVNGAGRDMTKAFEKAGHTDLTKIFALNFRIGRIESGPPPAWKRPECSPLCGASDSLALRSPCLGGLLHAQAPAKLDAQSTGDAIMREADRVNQGFIGERSTFTMVLINAQGDRTERRLHARDEGKQAGRQPVAHRVRLAGERARERSC